MRSILVQRKISWIALKLTLKSGTICATKDDCNNLVTYKYFVRFLSVVIKTLPISAMLFLKSLLTTHPAVTFNVETLYVVILEHRSSAEEALGHRFLSVVNQIIISMTILIK